jgi:hypothetical protein
VYGAALHLFGSSVLVGRLLSFALELLGFAAAFWIALSLGGRLAAAMVVVLSMQNLPMLWVAGTVRIQSLTTPLVVWSVLALAAPRRGAWSWALSPSLMLWSTSARPTNALAFLAIATWTGVRLRAEPKRLAAVAAIVGVQALVVFAPLLAAPRHALFHILSAQLGRGERAGWTTSFAQGLLDKFSIFLVPATSYFAIIGLTLVIAVALAANARRGWRPDLARPLHDARTAQLTLIVLAVLVYLPHVLLDRGFFPYFVTSSALLVPAIGLGVAELAREARRSRPFVLAAVAIVLVLGVAAVPRHWTTWIGSGDASFDHFREVARDLRAAAGAECTMVTMETTLAVEADCRVLPGLEYALFSYFPQLENEEAERWGVVNADLLAARVRELRPELIVLGPRGRKALRLGPASRTSPSPGFVARDGYTFVARYRISSGPVVRGGSDHIPVDAFVRDDLLESRAVRRRSEP